jgi:hypothetical protein
VTFYDLVDQTIELLRQRGRLSYRALKRQFELDDAQLDDLRFELIEVQRVAADEGGVMLVWTGQAGTQSSPAEVWEDVPSPSPPPHRRARTAQPGRGASGHATRRGSGAPPAERAVL